MATTPLDDRLEGKRRAWKYFLLLAACSIILVVSGLWTHDLWNPDEPRVAAIAAEMSRSGDLVVPRLNDKAFLEKPPLYFWTASAVMDLLGETAFTARLPSALAGIMGVLVIFLLARSMGFSDSSAFLSGFILATSAEYWDLARRSLIDMMLCFFITCAIASYFHASRNRSRTKLWVALFAISLSCAVLSKALVGLAIPLGVIAVWLIARKEFSRRAWFPLFAGSALCLVPLAIWLTFLHDRLGWDGVYEIVWTNNFGRFTGSRDSHVQPFYYYLLRFPLQFLPWALFVPLVFIHHVDEMRKGNRESPSLFLLIWLIVPFVFLSLSAGKRGSTCFHFIRPRRCWWEGHSGRFWKTAEPPLGGSAFRSSSCRVSYSSLALLFAGSASISTSPSSRVRPSLFPAFA